MVVDLTVAVEIGMVLAAMLFIKRSSETTQIMAVDESTETEGSQHSLVGRVVPEGVMVYRIFGAFFFGAADKLESVLKREKQEPEVLILRMRKVMAMDATGLNALEDLYERLHRKGKHLILSGPHTQPLLVMDKAGFLDRLGRRMFARTLIFRWRVPVKSLACRPYPGMIRRARRSLSWKRRGRKLPGRSNAPTRRWDGSPAKQRPCRVPPEFLLSRANPSNDALWEINGRPALSPTAKRIGEPAGFGIDARRQRIISLGGANSTHRQN